MKSKFIVFEGPHGSGKTTQAKLLKEYLDKHNTSSFYTKAPYLEEIKEIIDKYSCRGDDIPSYLLLYLYAADRFAYIKYIKESIKNNNVMIADRYLLSGCVYQQIQGIPLELIEQINFFCIEPNITFVFDVSLYVRKKRLNKSGRLRSTLFFKEENLEYEEKLYKYLFVRYKNKGWNIHLINGVNDKYDIHKKIINFLD